MSALLIVLAMTAFASKLHAAEITYTAAFSLERAPSNNSTVQADCGNIFVQCHLLLEDDLFAEATFTLPQFDPTLGTLTSVYLDFSAEFTQGVRATVEDNSLLYDGVRVDATLGREALEAVDDPSQLRFILDGFDLVDPAGGFGTPVPGRAVYFDHYLLYDACQTPIRIGNTSSCTAVSSVEDAAVEELLLAASGSLLSPLLIGTGSLTGSVAQLGVAKYFCFTCNDNSPLNPALTFRAALLQNAGEISITYSYVPLPSSVWLLGTGIAAVVARRRRRP